MIRFLYCRLAFYPVVRNWFLFTLFVLIFYPSTIYAQISGNIADEQNLRPLIGANIVLVNQPQGTMTDAVGNFRLNWDQFPVTLRISAVGYVSKDTLITGPADLRILLSRSEIISDELIVSSTRVADSDLKTRPIPTSRVTPEHFSNQNQSSAPELLRSTPGVFVQQTTVGQGSIYIRGRAGRDVLYLYNGLRMNPSFIRSGQNQYFGSIDPYSIQSIDVYRGPVSVYYGSDALSGGVNISPVILPFSGESKLGGQILTQANTGGNGEKTLNANLTYQREGASLYLNGTFRDYDYYRMPGNSNDPRWFPYTNNLENADYQYYSYQAAARFRLAPNTQLSIVSFYSIMPDAPRFDRMIMGYSVENDPAPTAPRAAFDSNTSPLLFSSNSISLTISERNRLFSTAKITAGYHHLRDDRRTVGFSDPPFYSTTLADRDPSFTASSQQETEHNTSNQLLLSTDFKTPLSSRVLIKWGGDYTRDMTSSERLPAGATQQVLPRYPDGSVYSSGGIFGHLNYSPHDNLGLEAGIRYSIAHANIPFEGTNTARGFDPYTKTFQQITGAFGLYWLFLPDWALISNISTGFRAPNIADLSELGVRRSDLFQTANTDLKPEKTFNTDLGVRYNTETVQAEIIGYWLHYFDKIEQSRTGFIVNRDGERLREDTNPQNSDEFNEISSFNAGFMNLFGVEFLVDVLISTNLKSGFTFNYTRGDVKMPDGSNVPVDRIPPVNGQFWISYEVVKGLVFRPQVRYALDHKRLSPEEYFDDRISKEGTPGFVNLQLNTTWETTDNFTVRLFADNLLNRSYREHASSLDGMARNVTLGLIYQF
jgi:outer membrane receptor protein involved in Fe transport